MIETVETVIIEAEDEEADGVSERLTEIFVTEDTHLREDVEELLEEQVVVEDGVQYEIELE